MGTWTHGSHVDVVEVVEGILDLLVEAEKAILVHDGSVSFRFGQRRARSAAFYKEYSIFVGAGKLATVPQVKYKLVFDYRTNRGELQVDARQREILKGRVPRILTDGEPPQELEAAYEQRMKVKAQEVV